MIMNIFLSIVLLPFAFIGYISGWLFKTIIIGFKSGKIDSHKKIKEFSNDAFDD